MIDLLIDRILNNPAERCDDRALAFRITQIRRWVTRAGGADVEEVRDGVGWMLTRRGRQVAEEAMATSGRGEAQAA